MGIMGVCGRLLVIVSQGLHYVREFVRGSGGQEQMSRGGGWRAGCGT